MSTTTRARRVRATDPVHVELVEFLEDEVALLDDFDLLNWVNLMSPDVVYRAPVRVTRLRDDGPGFAEGMYHFDETFATLFMKVSRLCLTASSWAENPPSRTRRFVTNVRVHEGDTDDRYDVTSSILLVRSRYDDTHLELLTARRDDVIRRDDDGWKIVRRTILLDQATLGLQNLTVFL